MKKIFFIVVCLLVTSVLLGQTDTQKQRFMLRAAIGHTSTIDHSALSLFNDDKSQHQMVVSECYVGMRFPSVSDVVWWGISYNTFMCHVDHGAIGEETVTGHLLGLNVRGDAPLNDKLGAFIECSAGAFKTDNRYSVTQGEQTESRMNMGATVDLGLSVALGHGYSMGLKGGLFTGHLNESKVSVASLSPNTATAISASRMMIFIEARF